MVGGGYVEVEFAGILQVLVSTPPYRTVVRTFSKNLIAKIDQLMVEMAAKGIDARLNHQLFSFRKKVTEFMWITPETTLMGGVDEILMAIGRIKYCGSWP